ncbi:ATP-dependent helicase Lhr and Lhr-like helicase [Lysobacter spongiicola DSM 21749]|uniref:ATP-dependent helicase Lhr and Lhr-like helicase n=2 Tax=Novilysobacter TaxID=3382699 RepID=A0A1T4LHZ0_9GAMM|nr:ATP-dependent helicase Lhr and Lhr-like helicase [Lysobacter spongiicola DSM 21749]
MPFQRELWRRYLAGESGLLHTPTGSGKTLAAFGGALLEALATGGQGPSAPAASPAKRRKVPAPVLKVLWITPLRALASDTVRALREPIEGLGLEWQVGLRTGDASARDKRLARSGRLDVLVTTPESLSLLLSYPDTASHLAGLRCVVVDEWHELLGNKRGVLLQLALARLRALAPGMRLWGLSATLGNLAEARDVLLPHLPGAPVVAGARPRPMKLTTLLPPAGARFPWAGHLGLSQLQRVVEQLFKVRTSLLFTNTRAHAELWHQALSAVWREDPATLALHHGSLDPKLRALAESGLRDGSLRCVVATSSLDLGVDFPAVDQVLQIGSPKGAARLLQRAGRAKHRPGESGEVVCVPTHVLEVVEYAAAREAVAAGEIEARRPPRLSLDVLAQHCVTLALGGGFKPDELFAEVRATHAFAALDAESWQAVLDFIVQGGRALEHYPDYRRVVRGEDGVYRVEERRVAFRHRLSIGTITSDGSVSIKYLKGGRLGSVEESFIARLRPGDIFQFAGRSLSLVRLEDMTAYVRLARGSGGKVPKWAGGRMPLSSELAHRVEAVLAGPRDTPELRSIAGLLDLQQRLSSLPRPGRLLVETVKARDGRYLFVYPFAGRAAHEGLAALLAMRWGRHRPNTFGLAANDYGFALLPDVDDVLDEDELRGFLGQENLLEDLLDSMNIGELARRQFREIARVAGLLPPSLPGRAPRSMRQVQASSGLLYDVLERYDPDHMLLALARSEVLSGQLEVQRLRDALEGIGQRDIDMHRPRTLTPLSFPLWAEGMRGQLSTEDWKTRVQRAAVRLEQRHGG